MALKELIKDQTIIIDDHKRGSGEIKNWDDNASDIHIDKTTNYKLEGKRQKIRMRIPINSDKPIKIENGRRIKISTIPKQLQKEIASAFEDKTTREAFIMDVVNILRNFSTILDNKERVKNVIQKLAKHFDLKWKEKEITTYTDDVLQVYTQTYSDKNDLFYITVDREKIKIGEDKGYTKHQKGIQ